MKQATINEGTPDAVKPDAGKPEAKPAITAVAVAPAVIEAPGLAGLSQLRPGFTFTPADDAAFALGFPHVRQVVDGLREDENPQATALKILPQIERAPRMVWPRRTAQGLVRVWGLPAIWEMAPNSKDLRLEAEEALWKDSPIDRAEAAQLLTLRLEREVQGLSERVIEEFVLLLEAIVGTETVATVIVETLESFDAEMLLASWTTPPLVTFHLGYLLLRVPAPLAVSLRGRLRAALEKAYAFRPVLRRRGFAGQGASHARSIHLALNGGAAAEDTDRTLRWYTHVGDDPVLVRMRVALNRLSYFPDSRLVFLGGNDVLERYNKDWRKLGNQDEQMWFFHQHATVRAPQMLPIFLDMVGESLVRDEAAAWFDAHRDYARPFVEENVNGGTPRSAAAKRVLKSWG